MQSGRSFRQLANNFQRCYPTWQEGDDEQEYCREADESYPKGNWSKDGYIEDPADGAFSLFPPPTAHSFDTDEIVDGVDWSRDAAKGQLVVLPHLPHEVHVGDQGAMPVAVNLLGHVVHDQPSPNVEVSEKTSNFQSQYLFTKPKLLLPFKTALGPGFFGPKGNHHKT